MMMRIILDLVVLVLIVAVLAGVILYVFGSIKQCGWRYYVEFEEFGGRTSYAGPFNQRMANYVASTSSEGFNTNVGQLVGTTWAGTPIVLFKDGREIPVLLGGERF